MSECRQGAPFICTFSQQLEPSTNIAMVSLGDAIASLPASALVMGINVGDCYAPGSDKSVVVGV